jgi:hypothetical protein
MRTLSKFDLRHSDFSSRHFNTNYFPIVCSSQSRGISNMELSYLEMRVKINTLKLGPLEEIQSIRIRIYSPLTEFSKT